MAKYADPAVRHQAIWELSLFAHCCAIQPYVLAHPELQARMLAASEPAAQAAICREGTNHHDHLMLVCSGCVCMCRCHWAYWLCVFVRVCVCVCVYFYLYVRVCVCIRVRVCVLA
jgi:hypothetical protein